MPVPHLPMFDFGQLVVLFGKEGNLPSENNEQAEAMAVERAKRVLPQIGYELDRWEPEGPGIRFYMRRKTDGQMFYATTVVGHNPFPPTDDEDKFKAI